MSDNNDNSIAGGLTDLMQKRRSARLPDGCHGVSCDTGAQTVTLRFDSFQQALAHYGAINMNSLAAANAGRLPRLPKLSEELYEFYPSMSAETHVEHVQNYAKDYARKVASPTDWAEDFAHENGNYENRCSECGIGFMGHKRRTICKVCADRNTAANAGGLLNNDWHNAALAECMRIEAAYDSKDPVKTIAALIDWHVQEAKAHRPTAVIAAGLPPVDMILNCPSCGLQHIDAPDARKAPAFGPGMDVAPWTNPPHRSHLCHGCGHIWRPADVPTNGVKAIETTGKADSPAAIGAGSLLAKFDRDDLDGVADGLDCYEKTVNVGQVEVDVDTHLESTTAYAARFIRAYLAATPASSAAAAAMAGDLWKRDKSGGRNEIISDNLNKPGELPPAWGTWTDDDKLLTLYTQEQVLEMLAARPTASGAGDLEASAEELAIRVDVHDEALETAAEIADGWDTGNPDGCQIADAIRARKSTQRTTTNGAGGQNG